MARASDHQVAAALREIDMLVSDGLPALSACELAARRHRIPGTRRRSGAQVLQRLWADHARHVPADET